MNFSEDWKREWGINSVHNPTALLPTHLAGPTCFQPLLSPKTLTLLCASPSLSPPILPPLPSLSLPRFLQTADASASVPPSLSFRLAVPSEIPDTGLEPPPAVSASLRRNRLQLLRCPDGSVLALFPTGDHSDRVGYLVLSVKGSTLEAQGGMSDNVLVSTKKVNSHIVGLQVNPITDSGLRCAGNAVLIGYIMCSTLYAVYWFRVGFREGAPVLEFFGSKAFRSCGVVHACWSPHLPHECVVLLENGEMFLFDLSSCPEISLLSSKVDGIRLRVPWVGNRYEWLSCEFSWHPRIFVAVRSDGVFLVDAKSGKCCISCLANIEMLGPTALADKDRLIAFSRAGSDGFYFALASRDQLLLLDIREPLNPLLRWAHDLECPEFIDVFRLSQLRSHSSCVDESQKWASESGFCIILGSFWTSEFCVFCYGPAVPAPKGSFASSMSKLCRALYAWGLPSDLPLSGRGCPCGSCLIRDSFSMDALPEWIDWQRKKGIVLGYGILDDDLSELLFKPDRFGGFTLIRLTSSGRLELERYHASWEPRKKFEDPHREAPLQLKDSLLFVLGDEVYKFPKRFKYVNLDYLMTHLDENLTKLLVSNIKKHSRMLIIKESFNADFHTLICEKVRAHGFIPGSSFAPRDAFKDVTLPTSAHEVASRNIWAGLPVPILQLAFSSYSELLEVLVDKRKVSIEFLPVPDLHLQLPPFYLRKPSERSNKWSHKVQRGDGLVGPLLPLSFLQIIREVHKSSSTDLLHEVDRFAPEEELVHKTNEVIATAQELAFSNLGPDLCDDDAVPLSNDDEENWSGPDTPKSYLLYNQVGLLDNCPLMRSRPGLDASTDKRHAAFISKLPQKSNVSNNRVSLGMEKLFADLCSVELKLDPLAVDPGPQEMQVYKLLKGQYSRWQRSFNLYKTFCTDCRIHKQS